MVDLFVSGFTKQTHENITIQFHVVVSCDFKLVENDSVSICFDNMWSNAYGWESKKYALKRERYVLCLSDITTVFISNIKCNSYMYCNG